MPSASSELSSSIVNEGDFMAGPHLPIRLPQLDGPTSVHVKKKQLVPMLRERTMIPGGDYPIGSESDSHDSRSQEGRRYPGRKGYHQERGGKPPDKQGRGYPRRGRPPNDGRPLTMEGPLMKENPHNNGGPPDNGGPQEMEDHQEGLEDKDHQTSWTCTSNNSTTTSSYIGYNCTRKYI